MRSNLLLVFPLFIFSLFNFYPYSLMEKQSNCKDLRISADIGSTCFGSTNGNITLQIKGGVPPYNIHWANGYTGLKLRGLSEGAYPVSITDSNGCQWRKSLVVRSYRQLTASVKEMPSRVETSTGSLEIKVTGGDPPYIYNWIGASGVINQTNKSTDKISNLLKGNYTVAVTDSNLCTSVFNATVR